MKVKASLHIHTNADLTESIGYSVFELIDRAKALGFQVLAHTCHRYFVWDEAWAHYAYEQGVLLLPGVELEIPTPDSRNHIVAINCDASIAEVQTFKDLKNYKEHHSDLILIAAHPGFGHGVSLGYERLDANWELFDAVENSWFYTSWWNLNHKYRLLCRERNRPFINSSDLHGFNIECLATDYALLNLNALTPEAVAEAIRQGDFENVGQAKSLAYIVKALGRVLVSDQKNKLTNFKKVGKTKG